MFDFKTGGRLCGANEENASCRLRPEPLRKTDGVLSFLRHDEIYRSDVRFKNILSLRPSAASRWSALEAEIKRARLDAAPFPSSAMSLGLGIPWQVALQQSLPPLSQPEPLCNDKKWSVEPFSADSACLTDSVSQNSTQSTYNRFFTAP